MADLIARLLAHIRGMWRFRWPALVVSWLVAVAGAWWVYTLPNQYETLTQVYVDTDSTLRPLLKGLSTEVNVMNRVELMTRALLSRTNLEIVARETDLDLRASTPREHNRLIDGLQAAIVIRERGNNIYNISFQDQDPKMTRDVVQSLLDSFMGDTLRDRREDSEQTMRFLQDQIDDYEMRLDQAESRLAQFKKRNVGMMPGATGNYYERLESALETQSGIKRQIAIKTRARQELLKQLEGEEPTFGIGPAPQNAAVANCSMREQIDGEEDRLAQLRLQYTEKHPDVIGTIDTIAILESRCEEELAAATPGASDPSAFNPLDMNPVYQNLKINLSTTEVELAQLRAELLQQNATVTDLQKSVDTVPEVEAQLAQLNRDYDVTKTRYDQLLQRLENARLGSDVGTSTSDVKFRIIDAPTMPIEPIGPNRFLFLAVTLIAGLAAGLGFSFLMDQVRPVFITRKDLRERTGLPVLGAVAVVLMPHQRFVARMQTALFALGILVLVTAFGVVMFYEDTLVEIFQSMQLRGS